MNRTVLIWLVLFSSLTLFSCQSDNEVEKRRYHESKAREFNSQNEGAQAENKTHDSLVLVQAFRDKILGQLDSLRLISDSIKAKYEFDAGKLPSKIEFGLMRAEEAANDLRLKIRHSKEAQEDWVLFQIQVKKDLEKIKRQYQNFK